MGPVANSDRFVVSAERNLGPSYLILYRNLINKRCATGRRIRTGVRWDRVSEYRDYENGVADVLAFLADDSATVSRDVRLQGRSGNAVSLMS